MFSQNRLTLFSLALFCAPLLPPSLTGSLALQPAVAQSASSAKSLFNLPVNSKPGRSQGAASRGCDRLENNVEISLLVPSREVAGQTVSSHPSFLWTISQPVSVPIKFTLLRPGDREPIYEKQISSAKAGIVALELPANSPELAPDRLYLWTVSLICNDKRPSANPFYASWIERVAPSNELKAEIAAAGGDRDRAIAYARSGAWYDALAAFYRAKSTQPNDPQLEADFNALLTSVGLQN